MNLYTDGRRDHVRRMRTNFALEGLLPDSEDMALQNAYIVGELTLHEMWTHALAFALACAADDLEQFPQSFNLKTDLISIGPQKRAI
jgi:hypothetical protein